MRQRIARLRDEPRRIDAVAQLLARQWPQQGSASTRRAQLVEHCRARAEGLPTHILLIDGDGGGGDGDDGGCLVAHCRLQPACENADGISAAVVSFVVEPSLRGTGLGRSLLRAAEESAAAEGYGYLYLWTSDAQGFYAACGYVECERVSLQRAALASVGAEAVDRLERMLSSRAASRDESAAPGDTWMRRRIRERCAPAPLSAKELRVAVDAALPARAGGWRVHLARHLEWERQVGPCCGLAALRMARAALLAPDAPGAPSLSHAAHDACIVDLDLSDDAEVDPDASLLGEAVRRGFSSDGEIYDVHDLAALAASVCGMRATVVRRAGAGIACGEADGDAGPLSAARAWLDAGGLVIVPYDKHEGTHEPVARNGHAAHYALITGYAAAQSSECRDELRLVCVHGLSRRPLVVTPAELAASNAQLRSVKPDGGRAAAGPGGCSGTTGNGRVVIIGEAGMRLAGRALYVSMPQRK